ncbi:MAG: hypothetical protein IPK62_05060 [Bacteroidetes bacterium]|nr:hypothetical protein [Bacteroidota bacterium]
MSTNKIYELDSNGPVIFSKDDMERKKYPNPKGDIYLIYKILRECSLEFGNAYFDLRKLPNYESNRNSAKPITASLTELLKSKL